MFITDRLSIDDSELEWRTATSQGPGGQHVNRSETRVILRFDVVSSPSLSESQRALIIEKLGSRITRDGILQLSVQKHRSQARNRDEALERLSELLRNALHVDPPRKKSKPTRAAKRRRVDDKRQHSKKKEMRRKPGSDD